MSHPHTSSEMRKTKEAAFPFERDEKDCRQRRQAALKKRSRGQKNNFTEVTRRIVYRF